MKATRGLAWCALLGVIGLGLSGYLAYLHFGLMRGELLGGPACSTGAFNCHAVTGGPWGSVFGMPLSLWGILGYLVIAALALFGESSFEAAGASLILILALSLVFVAADLILLYIMASVIRFFCLFCLLTYAVNLGLLIVSARAAGLASLGRLGSAFRALVPSSQHPAAGLFWGMALVGIVGVLGVHAATLFVSQGPMGSVRKQMREYALKQPRVSVDTTGDPIVGSPSAPLLIIEFSDFLCPACQRASKLNPVIFANHRMDAAFVFKHYPLDNACNEKVPRAVHPGSCRIAAAAECAHLQGKFWPFHDLVFGEAPSYKVANIDGDIRRLGLDVPRFQACMASGQGMDAVKRDIAEGAKFGLSSTPTYVINGLPVAGGVSPSVFEEFAAVLRERN